PALVLALAVDGASGIAHALAAITWRGLGAVLYLGAVATVVAYAIWGDLLRRYPTAAVTPFALLVPFVAAAGSALAFGERCGALGRVVGSIGVQRVNATTAEIRRLYLDKHLRGRGLGRALVEEVLAWCRAHRYTRLVLWSDTRFEHSHRLYDRMGFARVGERTVPDDLNNSREYRFERDV